MNHLTEDTLLALRDGADTADAPGAARHLEGCAACAGELAFLRDRADTVGRALASLDAAAADIEDARARVRARVAAHAAEAAGTRSVVGRRARRSALSGVWGLSRAAGILLLAAGAAYALPGSPLRRWVDARLAPPATATSADTPAAPEATATLEAPEATGVRLSVPTGALQVILRDVAPGAEVRVRLVPGTEAAVFAPAGSRFTSATGRVEARVTPGEVRVELPRGVDPVSLLVGGRTYLRGTGAGLDVTGPVASRTDDEIVFRVPGG